MGEVFKKFIGVEIFSLGSSIGTGSEFPVTVDFDENRLLNQSLFCWGSLIISSFSRMGGIEECFPFFIKLVKIENFFFAEMELLCIVELTEL